MTTQILLIEDVEKLGRKGDIVKVKPGYARNYLFPQQKAVPADKQAVRRQEKLREQRRIQAEEDKTESEKLAQKLAPVVVNVSVKVDHEGHMYGSVSAADLITLVNEQAGVQLEKRFFLLKHPIKALGSHQIELKLKEGVPATFQLEVAAEEQETHG